MSMPTAFPSPAPDAGAAMYELVRELYPICRSITGKGVRRSLEILQRHVPLDIHEVPSGTPVFDWTVPREWNVTDAYIRDRHGRRVVDFRQSNLHVVSYSTPVAARMPLGRLRPHLFSNADRPDWIPYRTAYYTESWGFCVTHRQLEALADEEYDVCIDASLRAGHLTYGEYVIPGETAEEVLISAHVCHPSLANDNLSGIALATWLAGGLRRQRPRYTYRFLFIPGTIGAITWLARNESQARRIRHGLVLACAGDPGPFTYKQSRRGDAAIDRAARHVLAHLGKPHEVREFTPYGYDERQFCSPGFDLPVGCFMRTPHGEFPQYHTSADDLDLVTPGALAESLATIQAVLAVLEHDRTYRNTNPKCEPQLGRRGLYAALGGPQRRAGEMAMLWVLNLSDGRRSLLDIAERARLPFDLVHQAADALLAHGLLARAADGTRAAPRPGPASRARRSPAAGAASRQATS
jgi:aminopeptidase-like protein